MKQKIKNIFKKIYDFFNKGTNETRGLSLVKCLCVFLIGLYIGASTIICFVGYDYIQEKMEQVETKLEVVDKPVNYANSINNNVFDSNGSYDYLYFNVSLTQEYINTFIANFDYSLTINGSLVGQSSERTLSFYPIIYSATDNVGLFLHKITFSSGNNPYYSIEMLNLTTFSTVMRFYESGFGFNVGTGVYELQETFVSSDSISIGGSTYVVGNYNSRLTNLICPSPFLFEGHISQDMESSGINTTIIETVYFNISLSNIYLKRELDNNIGYTEGIDIEARVPILFDGEESYIDYTLRLINNSANCFIQVLVNNILFDYLYIYDSLDTDDDIYWYGINPILINNNGLLFTSENYDNSIQISYDGTLESSLNFLFSDTNDFTTIEELPPTYEEGYEEGYEDGYGDGLLVGYQDGKTDGYNEGYQAGVQTGNNSYNAGFSAGTTNGINIVQSNPNRYQLYSQTDLNNAIASAEGEGFEEGIQQVLDNLSLYGLYTEEQYQAALDGTSQDFLNPVFSWLNKASGIISNIFSVQLFPGVTLGLLILLPLIFALFFFILKLFFGG